ncbi:MAG TPA: hypothetical protein VLU96_13155 [Gaiellaceae bacterium]|nr:hypothetical protein [Gaiellaceae bacterium]
MIDSGAIVLDDTAPTERSRPSTARAIDLIQSVALGATAAIIFGSAVLLAAVHIDDRYWVTHVSGSWMTLARFVHEGHIYPPLHQDGHTFGTFYMPLPFILHGAVSLLTGEYLVSGKLTAYATAIVMFSLLFLLLRRVGCSLVVSAALVAAVLATPAGYMAAVSIRGDALSVVVQLAALLVVWRSQSRRAVLGASALCALGIASKTTAVWAPGAIVIWLLLRDRRAAARFTVAFLALTAATLGFFELVSSGRLWENVGALAFSQPKVPGATPLAGASTLIHLAFLHQDALWLLFPFAVLACALSLRRREVSLFQLALAISLLSLVVILRDPGAGFNHLLDMSVLTALVVGELWAHPQVPRRVENVLIPLLTVALVIGAATAYADTIKPDIGLGARLAIGRGSDAAFSTDPLRGIVKPGDRMLSEDPTLPILAGQVPVTDPLTLPRLAKHHPEWIAQLKRRIDRREFDEVVLIRPLDPSAYRSQLSFGQTITNAIAANYRPDVMVPTGSLTYFVYVPR